MADYFKSSLESAITNEAQYSQELPQILETIKGYDKKTSYWILTTLFQFLKDTLSKNPNKNISSKSLAIDLLMDCIQVSIVEVCSYFQKDTDLIEIIRKHIHNQYKVNAKDDYFTQFNTQLKELIQILAEKFPAIAGNKTSFKNLYDELKQQGIDYPREIIMCVNLKTAIDEAKKKKKQASQQQQEQQTQKSSVTPGATQKKKKEITQQITKINNLYEGVLQYVTGALQNSNSSEVKANLQLYQVTTKNLNKDLQDLICKISDPEYEAFTEKYFNDLMEKQNFVNDYLEAYEQFQQNTTANGLKNFKQSLEKYLQKLEKMNSIRKSFENLAGSFTQNKSLTNEEAKKSFGSFHQSGIQQSKQSFEKQEPIMNQFTQFKQQPQKIEISEVQKPFEFEPITNQPQQQQQAAEAFGGFNSQIIDKPQSMGNSSMQFQFFQEGSEQNSNIEDKVDKKNQFKQIEQIKEEEIFVKQSMGFQKGNIQDNNNFDQNFSPKQQDQQKRSTNFDDFGNQGQKQVKKSTNFDEFGSFEKSSPQKQKVKQVIEEANFNNFDAPQPVEKSSKKKKKKKYDYQDKTYDDDKPIENQEQNAFGQFEQKSSEKKKQQQKSFEKYDENAFEKYDQKPFEQNAFEKYDQKPFEQQEQNAFENYDEPPQKKSKEKQQKSKIGFQDNAFESFSKKQDQFGFSNYNDDKPKNLVQRQTEFQGFAPKEQTSYHASPKQQRRYNESEIPDDFEERFSNASLSTISMMDVPMKNILLNLKPKHYGRTLEYNGSQFTDFLTKNLRDKNNRRFKLSCLKDKSVLYEADGLQVGIQTSNFYDYMTSKNFSLMTIYFGNLRKSSEKIMYNFETIYSGDYTFSLWANPESLEQSLRPNAQLKQELIINYNTLPFTQINCNISYNDSYQKTHSIVLPLPALIPKFMVFKDIDKEAFKYKWKLKRNDIITSQFFKPNSHILRSSNALLKFVPKLLELTDYKQFITQPKNSPHLQSYKLGGIFELNQPDIEFMIKISLKPNAVAFIQATGFSSYQLVVENIIQTFVFLLAASGNDNQPIIMQPNQQENASNDDQIPGFQF